MKNLRSGKASKLDYQTTECAVCNATPSRPVMVFDDLGELRENIMPLCEEHHREQYHVGWLQLANIYPVVAHYLYRKGWVFNNEGFKNKQ